ncbi:hypothetical protein [Haladaptatus sp. NG-SE-30]
MNWDLIARCGVRYTLFYAGIVVALVFFVTQSELALIGVFGLGMVVLLLALGGTGTVRMSAAMTNAQALGFRTGIVDATDLQAKNLDSDIKLLFFGVGLLIFAAVTLVLVG